MFKIHSLAKSVVNLKNYSENHRINNIWKERVKTGRIKKNQ